ncbi:TPA: hypothetical protein H1012_01880 [archaeon]|nr:hypothetical protein [Candidatus Naiadarchaeales archaeon SRR2090153.bin461]HIK02574.1 hypothetical protein [Candidatus Naiadarchaeales archaeon SRR2090159.bin1288]
MHYTHFHSYPPNLRNRADETLGFVYKYLHALDSYKNGFLMAFVEIFDAIEDASELVDRQNKPSDNAREFALEKINERYRFYSLKISKKQINELSEFFRLKEIIRKKKEAERLSAGELAKFLNIWLPLSAIDYDFCFNLAAPKSIGDRQTRELLLEYLHNMALLEKLTLSINNHDIDAKKGNFNFINLAKEFKFRPKFFEDYAKRCLKAAQKSLLQLTDFKTTEGRSLTVEYIKGAESVGKALKYLKEEILIE